MSLFGSIARELKGRDGLTWGEISTLWGGLFGTYQSRSGVAVGWKTALRCSTFLACTRRIAEAVSTVPTKVYKKPRGGKREEAFDHPLYELLDSEPNEWQDPLQFKETLAVHCAVTNNAYAFKNVVRSELKELIPIIPTHVQPKWTNDRTPYYLVTAPDGSQQTFTTAEVLHIRGLSWDGLRGLDAVQLLREPLGLALATEQTHAMLHAHGARPSGIISVNKGLDEKELVRLAAWVKKHYSGLDNVSRVMILDNDAKFTPFDMKGVDAQHIQLRNHEIESICHGMGVLPIVIGYPAEMAARCRRDADRDAPGAHDPPLASPLREGLRPAAAIAAGTPRRLLQQIHRRRIPARDRKGPRRIQQGRARRRWQSRLGDHQRCPRLGRHGRV